MGDGCWVMDDGWFLFCSPSRRTASPKATDFESAHVGLKVRINLTHGDNGFAYLFPKKRISKCPSHTHFFAWNADVQRAKACEGYPFLPHVSLTFLLLVPPFGSKRDPKCEGNVRDIHLPSRSGTPVNKGFRAKMWKSEGKIIQRHIQRTWRTFYQLYILARMNWPR